MKNNVSQTDRLLPAEPASHAAVPEQPSSDRSTDTQTVLVVDDEILMRTVIRHALSRSGYRVLEAENGVQALEVAKEHDEISLVISDIRMPQLDGLQLIDVLSKMRPALMFMLVSGCKQDDAIRKCIADHDARFIAKPFSPVALVKTVDGLFANVQ